MRRGEWSSAVQRRCVVLLSWVVVVSGCGREADEGGSAAAADERQQSAAVPASPSPVALAVAQAQALVQAAVRGPESLSREEGLLALRAAYARGDLVGAGALFELLAGSALDLDLVLVQAEGLIEGGEIAAAQALLFEWEPRHLGETRIAALIERSFDADPDFVPPVRTVVADVDLDAIRYLGGGSTVVLRLLKERETVAAFKPKQRRLQSCFRAEIAAWRLCPLIRCGFDIPRNVHVRLTWRAFDGLYARINTEKQRSERHNLKDVSLVREDGEDWVHGTWKDWVPDFTVYPIELSSVWRPWLLVDGDPTTLDGRAAESLGPILRQHPRGEKVARELTRHMGEMSRRDLARQISNLLVFDYLINNWDRFSGVPEFWGVNCQFANGRFVSIDNGAAFPRTPNEKPARQLKRVQRFSRTLVQAVRALDHDKTLARLFPEATPFEIERFETFWQQRSLFLAYVDELVAAHGAEAVLFFE